IRGARICSSSTRGGGTSGRGLSPNRVQTMAAIASACAALGPPPSTPQPQKLRAGWDGRSVTLVAGAAAARARAARAPAAATATSGRTRLLPGLAHRELAALEVRPVQLGDGPVGILAVGHLDEPEPPRAAGGAVDDDRGLLAGALLRKEVLEVL